MQVASMNRVIKLFDPYANYLLLAILLLFFAVNFDIFSDLFSKWYAQDLTGAYSHGLLVAFIVLYLVYKTARNLREQLIPTPSVFGFGILLGSQCLLFLAKIDGINFIQHILLIVSALAIAWSAYSYRIAKHFVVPAILFSLSLPVWAGGKLVLQKVAIFMTNTLLGLTGLPYFHQGPLFHFPNGIIEVAPECAGLQQLLVSLIIGLLFSVQHGLRLIDTVKILIYISVASVLINTVRIIIIMYIGYYTKMESSLITQHVLLGWVVYGVGIFLFLFFYSRKKFITTSEIAAVEQADSKFETSRRSVMGLYAGLLAVVLLPTILIFIITTAINQRQLPPLAYTLTADGWSKLSLDIKHDWKPKFPPGDELETATYVNGVRKIYMYINRYSRIKKDIEPINMLNLPYNPKVWTLQRQTNLNVSTTQGNSAKLRLDYLSTKKNEPLTVLTYYIVNGKIVNNLVTAKLATLFGMLRLNFDIKVVCLATNPEPGSDGGKSVLLQFFNKLDIH